MRKQNQTVKNLRIAGVLIVIASGALFAGRYVAARYHRAQEVTAVVESLNGAVGVNGPSEVSFNVGGKPPLVSDHALIQLSPGLGQCRVESISLENTPISDVGLRALVQHCRSTIRELDLTGTKVTGDAIELLARCPHLEFIAIPVDSLSPASIAVIRNMTQLKAIAILDTNESDQRIKKLRQVRPDLELSTPLE